MPTRGNVTIELDVEASGVDVSDTLYFVRDRVAVRFIDQSRVIRVVAALDREAEEKLRLFLNDRAAHRP